MSLTQQKARKYSAESGHSPTPVLTTAQNGQQEHAVVALGVMYPKMRSRESSSTAENDVVPRPPHVTLICQGPEVVFYDPLSPSKDNALTPGYHAESSNSGPESNSQNNQKDSQRTKAEAIEAVVRDLARLLARDLDHENRME